MVHTVHMVHKVRRVHKQYTGYTNPPRKPPKSTWRAKSGLVAYFMQNLMDIMVGKFSELSDAPEWRNLGFKVAIVKFEFLAGENLIFLFHQIEKHQIH